MKSFSKEYGIFIEIIVQCIPNGDLHERVKDYNFELKHIKHNAWCAVLLNHDQNLNSLVSTLNFSKYNSPSPAPELQQCSRERSFDSSLKNGSFKMLVGKGRHQLKPRPIRMARAVLRQQICGEGQWLNTELTTALLTRTFSSMTSH